MFGKILRIALGLSALWGSGWLHINARQQSDEMWKGNDIGITHGPQVEADRGEVVITSLNTREETDAFIDQAFREAGLEDSKASKNKPGDFFAELIEEDERERKAREKPRRQPQKGDESFFGENPGMFAARPENKAKLESAHDYERASEASEYLGYLLILSAIFPSLWRVVWPKKPEPEPIGETHDTQDIQPAAADRAAAAAKNPGEPAGQTAAVVDETGRIHSPRPA